MTRSFATGMLAVLASAGMALGTVTKFTTFEVWASECAEVDGVASMKYDAGRQQTHVTVVVHNLTAGETYTVIAGSDSGTLILSATANNGGNLTAVGDSPQGTDLSGANSFVALLVGEAVRVVSWGN
jgi:hypothetical protein